MPPIWSDGITASSGNGAFSSVTVTAIATAEEGTVEGVDATAEGTVVTAEGAADATAEGAAETAEGGTDATAEGTDAPAKA